MIGSKFFYALGYYTPENYVVHFRRENLAIRDGVTWRDASGKKHPLTERTLNEMLKPQPKGPDGTYRALASRWIAGQAVGRSATGEPGATIRTTPIAHQDRRVLRGLACLQRLAEPSGHAVHQHDGCAGDRKTAGNTSSII